MVQSAPGSSAPEFSSLERDLGRAIAADQVSFQPQRDRGPGRLRRPRGGRHRRGTADGGRLRLGAQPPPGRVPVSRGRLLVEGAGRGGRRGRGAGARHHPGQPARPGQQLRQAAAGRGHPDRRVPAALGRGRGRRWPRCGRPSPRTRRWWTRRPSCWPAPGAPPPTRLIEISSLLTRRRRCELTQAVRRWPGVTSPAAASDGDPGRGRAGDEDGLRQHRRRGQPRPRRSGTRPRTGSSRPPRPWLGARRQAGGIADEALGQALGQAEDRPGPAARPAELRPAGAVAARPGRH